MVDYNYYCKSEEHHQELGIICLKTKMSCVAMFAKDRKQCQEHCAGFKDYPEYKLKKMQKGVKELTLAQIIKQSLKKGATDEKGSDSEELGSIQQSDG